MDLSVYKASENERELPRSDLQSLVPNVFDGVLEKVGEGGGGGIRRMVVMHRASNIPLVSNFGDAISFLLNHI